MATPSDKIQATLDIINLTNTAIPGILKIIEMIRDSHPDTTLAELLPQIDEIFKDNLKEIEEWKKAHPAK
jgi:hypothetical protein